MAKPTRIGQLVRWLHYTPVMRISEFTDLRKGDDPNTSVYTKAVCEWITSHEVYQKATFPISELEVAEPAPVAATQTANEPR